MNFFVIHVKNHHYFIGLSSVEERELSQKLSMLNRILNEEVEILSNQTKKIQSEGFDIPVKVNNLFNLCS